MIKHIITHPGGAHRDEFLAICVFLALVRGSDWETPFIPVFRRPPTPEEMLDPEVAVIDIGQEFNIDKNNFDHHQDDATSPARCSLSLVLQSKVGLYEAALASMPWLPLTEVLDSKGPTAAAESLGVKPDIILRLNSPVERLVLDLFAAEGEEVNRLLVHSMLKIGRAVLAYPDAFLVRTAYLEKSLTLSMVNGLQVVTMPVTEETRKNPTLGLNWAIEKVAPNAAISVVPDERGEGLTLFRRNDNPRVNFTRLREQQDILFVHNGGYIAKTKAVVDQTRLKQLIALAIEL